MSLTSTVLPFVAITAAIGAVLVVLKGKSHGARAFLGNGFKAKMLLTPNELSFLVQLESAVPALRFCPQVAMGALLDPAVPRKDAKNYFRLRGMFAQKIVDFVAQDRATGAVLAVIELDDRTHDNAKDTKRDAMLSSAGYRVIRWHSKDKPDADAIRAALQPAASVSRAAPVATSPVSPSTIDSPAPRP